MVTISLEITPPEKGRLLAYCESVNDSGHWGDGAVELPDEKILEEKIRAADGVVELSIRDLDILVIHIEDATDHGFVLIPEDQTLLLKLVEALESSLRSQLALVERLEETLGSVTAIVPENRPGSARVPARMEKTPGTETVPGAVTGAEEITPSGKIETEEDDTAPSPPDMSSAGENADVDTNAAPARDAVSPSFNAPPSRHHERPAAGKTLFGDRIASVFRALGAALGRMRPGDAAPDLDRAGDLTLDERIRRAKAAAKRIKGKR